LTNLKSHKIIKPLRSFAIGLVLVSMALIAVGNYLIYKELAFLTNPCYTIIGIGSLLILLGLGCLVSICWIGHFEIHKHRLTTYSYFGHIIKQYNLEDFESWYETKGEEEYSYMRSITLVQGRKKFRIPSLSVTEEDYKIIKDFISEVLPETSSSDRKRVFKTKAIGEIMLVLLGLMALFGAVYFYLHKDIKLQHPDLKSVTGILTSVDTKTKGDNKHIYIELLEYPNIRFCMNSIILEQTNPKMVKEQLKEGSFTKIYFPLSELKKLEARPNEINYLDICSLNDDKKQYLTLEQYNDAHTTNNRWGILVCTLLGLSWIFLAFNSRYNKNTRYNIEFNSFSLGVLHAFFEVQPCKLQIEKGLKVFQFRLLFLLEYRLRHHT
jgi:hypothetical protein